jgi:hypothetical protein
VSQIGREEVSGVPGIEHEIHRFVEHKPRLKKIKFRLKINSSHHLEQKYVSKMWGHLWFLNEMIKVMHAKNMKKSWERFGSYLLNSTANPAQFEWKCVDLALLFSR